MFGTVFKLALLLATAGLSSYLFYSGYHGEFSNAPSNSAALAGGVALLISSGWFAYSVTSVRARDALASKQIPIGLVPKEEEPDYLTYKIKYQYPLYAGCVWIAFVLALWLFLTGAEINIYLGVAVITTIGVASFGWLSAHHYAAIGYWFAIFDVPLPKRGGRK